MALGVAPPQVPVPSDHAWDEASPPVLLIPEVMLCVHTTEQGHRWGGSA